jgi:copper(I)-binding protein
MPTRTRRLTLALVLVPFLALAGAGLSGCGVPPPLNSPAPAVTGATPVGVNVDAPDHSVALRDLLLPDPGAAGYPAGGSAPLAVQVWNNTNKPISLTSATAAGSAPVILVSTGETPAPSGDTSFAVLIPPGANVTLSQQAGRFLLIRCVPSTLAAGTMVPMTFTFDNGVTLSADVPVGLVLSIPATNPSTAAKAC